MSMGSPGKNTGVGCQFLLQWTTFCQNSSLWPAILVALRGMARSFTELQSPFTTIRLLCRKGKVASVFPLGVARCLSPRCTTPPVRTSALAWNDLFSSEVYLGFKSCLRHSSTSSFFGLPELSAEPCL